MENNTFLEFFKKKYIDPGEIETTVARLREEKKTIATLNGSFDLLHAGHLHIIYEASKCADVLIVALNTDASIKKYKSKKRPIISLQHRLHMMSALAFVTFVTWFDETDPCILLKKIKPDVHVNGADWGKECIEANTVISCGGKLHIVELIPGLSTSEIIKRIKECD